VDMAEVYSCLRYQLKGADGGIRRFGLVVAVKDKQVSVKPMVIIASDPHEDEALSGMMELALEDYITVSFSTDAYDFHVISVVSDAVFSGGYVRYRPGMANIYHINREKISRGAAWTRLIGDQLFGLAANSYLLMLERITYRVQRVLVAGKGNSTRTSVTSIACSNAD
jgi:hypothetical protein